MKVAVLTGGTSLEREISLNAGKDVALAMEELGHETLVLDVAEDFSGPLIRFAPDVAFFALHGGTGENGALQGMMEVLNIPYTHSGVKASALAMDKEASKAMFRDAGLPVPRGRLAAREEFNNGHLFDVPYLVKPNDDGSSLGGFYLVEDEAQPTPDVSASPKDIFLVEEFIPGREFTVSVLNGKGLAVSEFMIDGFYSFENKYEELTNNRVLPADIPADVEARLIELAERAHAALGCRGLSRTDFRWNETQGLDGIYIIELNTLPGFRRNSNSAQHAAHVGVDFPALCNALIQDAAVNK